MLNLDPATMFGYIIVLLISLPVHEFAHAWTATRFGDTTPERDGRLTLNPLAHLDPIGALVFLFAGFGWAKPVMVNPYALQRRSPAALMWVALAGPFSNLLLAILVAIPFRLGLVSAMAGLTAGAGWLPTLPQLMVMFVISNITLMLFNMIPLAPLDGEKIALYLLPPNMSRPLEAISPYSPFILLALVVVLPRMGIDILNMIIGAPSSLLFWMLVG